MPRRPRQVLEALVARKRKLLVLSGLAGVTGFVLLTLALHAAWPGAGDKHLSTFAHSPFGNLWALAVYLFIAGGSLLMLALRPRLASCASARAGIAMLVLAALAGLAVAAFPVDDGVPPPTLAGAIHQNAAVAAFASVGGAMVVLVPAFQADPEWRRFGAASLALGILVTLAWVTFLVTTLNDAGGEGVVERILVAMIALWFSLLGAYLMRAPTAVAVKRRKASPATPVAAPATARAATPAAASATAPASTRNPTRQKGAASHATSSRVKRAAASAPK